MTTTGFGVELDGEILIRTVSDTEFAAQVNGLVLCYNIQVQQHWSPDYIEQVWLSAVTRTDPSHRVQIIPVIVERAPRH